MASEDAPEDGYLDHDKFYVRGPEGYRHIVEKTKGMLALGQHIKFRCV